MRPKHDGASGELRMLVAALALSSDGVLVVDPEGRATFLNESALGLLRRLHSANIPGEPEFGDFGFRDRDGGTWPAMGDPLSRALRGETVAAEPATVATSEGDLLWLITANPVRDDDGHLLGAVCAFQEVTSAGRAEADGQRLAALPRYGGERGGPEAAALLSQMAYERERWRTTVESMLDPVTVCDAEGRVTYINPAYERMIGRQVGKQVAYSEHSVYYQLYHPNGTLFAPEDLPLQRAALRDEEVRDVEIVHRASDGREFVGLFSASPLHGSDGKVVGAVAVGRDITELRRAEAAAANTEERYRLLFANSIDAVLLTSPDGSILDANPAAEKMFGISMVEMRRVGRSGIVDTSDPRLERALRERAETLRYRGELTCVRGDGAKFEAEVSMVTFQDGDGRTRTSMIVRDLTQSKISERELSESDLRYRTLFAQLSEGLGVHEMIFAADGTASDFRFLEVNAAFETITGLRRADVLGRTVREVLPGIEQSWIDRYGEVVRTGMPVRFESYAGPLQQYFEVIAYRTSPGQFAALFIDVTARKRAESERERLLAQVEAQRERAEEKAAEALRSSAQLNALLQNLGEAVVIADAKGRVILRNQVARDITGISDDQTQAVLERRQHSAVLYPDGRPMPDAEQGLLKVLRGEEVAGQEVIFVRHDGTWRWLLISGSTVVNERGEVELAIVVYSDITAMRQLEKVREDFIALAAHELKTPLTTIKGFVQLLNRQGGHDEREQEAFLVLRAQTERIVRIVQGMLTMAQVCGGNLRMRRQRCDLVEIARGVARAAEAEAPRHAFSLAAEGSLWVEADLEQIQMILANLVENAVKYSPEGGPVAIEARQVGTEAVVSVRDEGIGIAEEHQARLFQPFYQAAPMTRPTTGMGLGLHISREIIHLHGGRIWFESTPHVGSTFSISLPLAAPGG
ncbi:MAG: PAS domain S-box protein [Chloroflexota bacterium]